MTYNYRSIFKDGIQEYIQFRRDGGAKYSTPVNVLENFDLYLYNMNHLSKTLDRTDVMPFLEINPNISMRTIEFKTNTLRGFLKYLKEIKGYENIVMISTVPTNGKGSFIPYVFNEVEIAKILYYARNYPQQNSMNPNTRNIVSCVITMLYCTGMRIRELINLKVDEVDMPNRIIHINEAKNDNKRIVTISESLYEECNRYMKESMKISTSGIYFFDAGLSRNNGKITRDCIYRAYRNILKMSGIEHKGRGHGPRLHDLRVTFCCHSLKKLSNMNIDINNYSIYLSTYMGHKSLHETQYYLWLTSELFENALTKMEEYTYFIEDIFNEGVDSNGSI